MGRREFMATLGGAAAAGALAARAQQAAMPVIGFLSSRSPEDSSHLIPAFAAGLAEGDYVEGRNLSIESRWARGRYDLLPAMAAELVSRRVAVLTTAGGEPSALAAKQATSTIPIVFGIGGDPVSRGLRGAHCRAQASGQDSASVRRERRTILHYLQHRASPLDHQQ